MKILIFVLIGCGFAKPFVDDATNSLSKNEALKSAKGVLDTLSDYIKSLDGFEGSQKNNRKIIEDIEDLTYKFLKYFLTQNKSITTNRTPIQTFLQKLTFEEEKEDKASDEEEDFYNTNNVKATQTLKNKPFFSSPQPKIPRNKRQTTDNTNESPTTEFQQKEISQMEELKMEMEHLQELVKILKEQQEVLNALNEADLKNCQAESRKNEENKMMELMKSLNDNLSKQSKGFNCLRDDCDKNEEKKNRGESQLDGLKEEVKSLRNLVDSLLQQPKESGINGNFVEEIKKRNEEIKHLKRLLEDNETDNQHIDRSSVLFVEEQIKDIEHKIKDLVKNRSRSSDIVKMSPAEDFQAKLELEDLKENVNDLLKDCENFRTQDLLVGSMKKVQLPQEVKIKNPLKPPKSYLKLRKSSSDTEDLKDMLKRIEDELDEEDDSRETMRRILEIQRKLKKKKKKTNKDGFFNLRDFEGVEIRDLDVDESEDARIVLKQLRKLLEKSEKNQRGFPTVEDELKRLQDEINRLQPKDDFQTIPKQIPTKTQIQLTPEELATIIKKLTTNPNPPFTVPDQPQQPFPPQKSTQPQPQAQFFPAALPAPYADVPDQQQPYAAPAHLEGQIGELRAQIYGLQGAVEALERPEYVKSREDENLIRKLNQEIEDLKKVVSGFGGGGEVWRGKREVGGGEEVVGDALGEMAEYLKEAFGRSGSEVDGHREAIRKKLDELKKQLDTKYHQRTAIYQQQPNYYETSYVKPQSNKPTKLIEDKIKQKKLDVFEKVITKIIDIVVDKLVIAIPILIRKLFGVSVDYTDVGYGYDYGQLKGLAGLGIFGYVPLVVLKLVNGFSSFLGLLKKNKFFKNFLLPVLVLLGVAGLVLLLIWWFQPDDYGYGVDYNGGKYGYADGYRNNRLLEYNKK